MEVVNKKEENGLAKKCFCSRCKSELLVGPEDLGAFNYFKCPVCNKHNMWATKTDIRIMEEIISEEKDIVSCLKDNIPKRFHKRIDRIVYSKLTNLAMSFTTKNYNTEA